MSDITATVRVYYFPRSFPCGEKASCCGPIGRSEEELGTYLLDLRKEIPD